MIGYGFPRAVAVKTIQSKAHSPAPETMPKAKSAKPEDFIDNRLVRELDQSGFVKTLLVGK
jgi:hypothetical protein